MVYGSVLQLVLESLWFFLPAFIANGSPPVLAKLPVIRGWDAPIDGGVTWKGKPLLGSHKTWRGFIGGTLLAVLTAYLQGVYGSYPLSLGGAAVLGVGSLTGDMVKSFAKRRLGVEAGKPWMPWDQVDYVLGAFTFLFFLDAFNLSYFLVLLVAAPLASITANHVFYWMGYQEEAW